MTGYSPTHIPIPKNHADFERKATVLFREILKDPDAKRLGSEGQSQYGIDIVGFDGGNPRPCWNQVINYNKGVNG
jgi:hypothetical protein